MPLLYRALDGALYSVLDDALDGVPDDELDDAVDSVLGGLVDGVMEMWSRSKRGLMTSARQNRSGNAGGG